MYKSRTDKTRQTNAFRYMNSTSVKECLAGLRTQFKKL